ncbi:vinculin-like [Ranitomeya imitator]|uniref:vinculin-like n=1 Tax=Ranitomeya imitator TaxID=111125 RepID=UPI0037E987D7
MAKNCADERNTCGLLCGMEQVQTISNQLNIISSVKAATGCDDYSAEDVLLKNAQNLIHSILQTWKAAQAACIKSTENPIYSKEEEEVAAFCSQLRKKLQSQRAKDTYEIL